MQLLIIYCFLIVCASLVGGWLPLLVRLTHGRLELAVSLVAGFMLGVGVLHMLPHSLMSLDSANTAALWLLIGFLVMFFIERFFCFHHHDPPDPNGPDGAPAEHGESGDHGPHDHRAHDHKITWGGAAVGLTLHSVIGGVALAASVHQDAQLTERGAAGGLAVFLVILLHKPFDSLTLGTLMAVGGWSVRARHLVNTLFALAIPVGALLFHAGLAGHAGPDSGLVGCALAFSAGTFLCISSSDLLPELQFHHHDRAKLSAALLAGLVLAWAVSLFESQSHDHRHGGPARVEHRDHEH